MFELALAAADDTPRPVAEIMASAPDTAWREADPEDILVIETPNGPITVLLSSVLAKNHVRQVRTLAREGFYDGLSFYRVIEGFVAQGGDFTEEKEHGGAISLPAEFEEELPEGAEFTVLDVVDGYAPDVGFIEGIPAGRDPEEGTAWLAHCTGAFAFARDVEKDTASTEFYITLQPQRYLDRNLTVVGKVIDGIGVAQAAPRGYVFDGEEARPEIFPDRLTISGFTIAADMPEGEGPRWQVMDDRSETFAELVAARKARPSDFFYFRPGHVDLCQMPVPVRKVD
ncbi:peptidylprolyl isomerase [Parvularcula lutaonensis]|uniref:peptidylprolyl isomerase n=1 Tax=Parvularcula lutaonensis TaxID=491923 RepID=A0ABV7MCE0_9PROT|nr:peptidylprolyl isomerase [Parvularcula lutaonensis]GGY50526.1 peptidyl-prolyl cis-trans isomerase [Parvularcula lutaonensis]